MCMQKKPNRCWETEDSLHIKYHDEEWGVPLHDDNKLFEFLVLGGFQAGLSWWLILQRRDALREAFDNFNPCKISQYSSNDIERLLESKGIIKNKAKINSAINNARAFLEVKKEFKSFDGFIWRFVDGRTRINFFSKLSDLPAETEESRTMSKELRNRGFQFVGPTICYAFMQATGMVNDHLVNCFRYYELQKQ